MNAELTRLMALAENRRHQEIEAWARPRAEQGNADAQFILGYLVYAGAPVDFASSCEWFRMAAAQDHAEATYQLSMIDESEARAHSKRPINDTMRALLRRAAELGSERAQHDLGVLLVTGHGGFAKDATEARLWHERAARSGYLRSQHSFGSMCLRGEGGPAMVAEGLALLERIAATDLTADLWAPWVVSGSAEELCRTYERGLWGVAPDPQKAAAARSRLGAAQALQDRREANDDAAVGLDVDGKPIKRPFAFANPVEARRVLGTHMDTFRLRNYADLVDQLNKNLVARLKGPSGVEYEASVSVDWEEQPNGSISIGGSIQDFGWRTFKMISQFLSMAPDGTIEDQ